MKRTTVASSLSSGIKKVLESGIKRSSGHRVKPPKAKTAVKIPQPGQPPMPPQPMQPAQPPTPQLPY